MLVQYEGYIFGQVPRKKKERKPREVKPVAFLKGLLKDVFVLTLSTVIAEFILKLILK